MDATDEVVHHPYNTRHRKRQQPMQIAIAWKKRRNRVGTIFLAITTINIPSFEYTIITIEYTITTIHIPSFNIQDVSAISTPYTYKILQDLEHLYPQAFASHFSLSLSM
jgi:hypothetical protein